MPRIFEPERINLFNNPLIKETVIQDKIAKNPSILGLGNLVLRDRERTQPWAGRLDLLLQDPDTQRRYEVEIQLGKTDESHIIRTLEYWDIERKRYPQYDHCAVIVAEKITSRFHNIISLFNGSIPLIAIEISAFKFGDDIALTFNTVLDEVTRGLVDEDEEVREVTDRQYWIRNGSEETVKMADQLLVIVNEFAKGYELKYNKFYIGLAENGRVNNFATFRPRRNALNLEIRLPFSDEIQKHIVESGLDDMGYERQWGVYRLRLNNADVVGKRDMLKGLLLKAYQNSK